MLTKLVDDLLGDPITLLAGVICAVTIVVGVLYILLCTRMFMIGLKNLRRNLLRTVLTSLAIMVFAFKITLIWSVIHGIEKITTEQAKDFKVIITERWQVPSQLPMTYADYLNPESPGFLNELRDSRGKPLYGPDDFMIWSFYGGTIDPKKRTPETIVFFLAAEPRHIIPMMDELSDLDPKLVKLLQDKPGGCLLGTEKMDTINKRVGDRINLTSINYKDIDLEFEIVGTLPVGRYSQIGIMRIDYFNRAFDAYRQKRGVEHPLSDRRLNLIWLRATDRDRFDAIGTVIENAAVFQNRPVKVETQSSGTSSFMDAYKDLLLAMKLFLVPVILVVMALVMATAISITVRERRAEMAVMKVLGYRPNQIMLLILAEALVIGTLSGFLAAALTTTLMNYFWGGIPFRIAFLPVFRIPEASMVWGLAIGTVTTLMGSIIPAWTAREVKVSEVFSKVA